MAIRIMTEAYTFSCVTIGVTFILLFINSVGSVDDNRVISNNRTAGHSLAKRAVLTLFSECGDLKKLSEKVCPQLKHISDELDTVTCVLTFKEHPNDVISLKPKCQLQVNTYILNLISGNGILKLVNEFCKTELEDSMKCNMIQPGALLRCTLDKINLSKSPKCTNFLQRMKLLIFLDSRVMGLFLEDCNEFLKTSQCEEERLSCLQTKVETLPIPCRSQVLLASELQSEDIKFNKDLLVHCSSDREKFCHDDLPGSGTLIACLMQHRLEVSLKCGRDLLRHEQMIAHDYQVSRGLVRRCKDDIRYNHCRKATSADRDIRLAQILLCLENATRNGTRLNRDCSQEILAHRRMLMEDYRLSPELVSKCSDEINKLCDGLEVEGRTIHCLMGQARSRRRKQPFSPSCLRELELIVQEVDIGEDWRVDPVLREACQPVVATMCRDIQGGKSRVMSCLMERLGTEGMTDECETALLQVQYFVARDYKLDAALYRGCREDAIQFCHAPRSWTDNSKPEKNFLILPCLYRHTIPIQDKVDLRKSCLDEVLRVMRQRALSVELQPQVELACLEDLAARCNEKTGRGEEILCLQDNLESLQTPCKAAVSNFTEVQSVHIELNPIMIHHCHEMIGLHCKSEMQSGNAADVLDCLIEHKNDEYMREHYSKCRATVEHHQLISLKDYHFTFRFKEACRVHVSRFCTRAQSKAEVVACLSEVVRNDTLDEAKSRIPRECRQQLRSQLLQQRESVDLDPILRRACNQDIQRLCPNVPHGNSKVLECLELKRRNLTDNCHKRVFNVEKQDLTDSSVDFALLSACRTMIVKYCRNKSPSQALECLKKFKYEMEFDRGCRLVVVRRMVEQNSDYRFNPALQRDCQQDIGKFCAEAIANQRDDAHVEGRVISCLKKKFRERKLSLHCEQQLGVVLKEAALNYQLNPLLTTLCSSEIKQLCSQEEANDSNNGEGRVEECLKRALLKGLIGSRACRIEVVELINEGKADIQADPLLHRACAIDIQRHCPDVEKGASRVLTCMLMVLKSDVKSKELTVDCKNMLAQRVEMYKIEPGKPVENIGELYTQVSNSPSRRYFIVLAFTFIGMIFITGLFCGRVMHRSMAVKNK